MKKIQTLFAAALCGAILTITGNAFAQAGLQGYGTVVRVVGEASYSPGNNAWYPLLAGKILPVGSLVRTGDNSTVDLVLGHSVRAMGGSRPSGQPSRISLSADNPVTGLISYSPSVEQNTVRLTPNTTLAIDKLTITDTGADTVGDTELNLKKGKIFASVKKLSGASQYLIKLPNGIAGVRGTLFSLSAEGSVSCLESTGGGVVLSMVGANGTTETFLIAPGQSLSLTSSNGQPTPLSPEAMSALQTLFTVLETSTQQSATFSYDNTLTFISPTSGAR